MLLTEAITIEVGSAIAKSVLKLWLKDSKLSEDISLSLLDLLKARTSDAISQRRGQRQFETIGEKVGESLLPLFEVEGAHLDQNSRTAVALAVAEAFNKSKLSSEILAERNLQPTKLAAYVLTVNSTATQFFSEEEADFYKRIIEESCTYIVDIASQLPTFTERTFAEVLKREDQLILRTTQILQEIHQVRERLDPMTEAGRFEEDYRKAVTRNLDVLHLFGVDVSAANRRLNLNMAYITLSVSATQERRYQNTQNETSRSILSVDAALSRSHRLVILGSAGSGKTTLLQWIAVRSASRSFYGYLSDWNNSLPFYIRLRDCVQSGLPKPEVFLSFVTSVIVDRMPKGWVHTKLESGNAIVLVDGLDEVPTSQREDVHRWLKELVETYQDTRFIITSRPHAIEEDWMRPNQFSYAELQPMQLADIYMFIDHWHKALLEELQDDDERAELQPLAEHLKENVKHNRSLRNLATNPLMCAMLCALNRDRRWHLPADRIELYEACCSLLLERLDKERRIELSDYPRLNYRQKSLLLEDLAYWMIKNEWSEAPTERVDERFNRKLKDMPSISEDISASNVRRLLTERANNLREPVTEQVSFTHRTFQEFFAAKAASDEMDTGLLVANAHNDQWREVIILVAGLATKQMRVELIKGLIHRGDKDKDHQYQLYLLAVSCLETAIELEPEVRNLVKNRLGKIVPPRNTTDAKSLAAVGELALNHLTKGDYSDTVTAACISTLAFIGGDDALTILEGYASDTRPLVVDELLRAWDSFDREIYVRRILSKTFQNRFSLRLEHLPSLDGFQYFTHLADLNLSGCSQITDLTPLASLSQLKILNLSECSQITDLTPLAKLTQLTALNLSNCSRVSELNPLAGLTQLKSLKLSRCSNVSDFSALTGLNNLKELEIVGIKVPIPQSIINRVSVFAQEKWV